jgi:two-component system, NtrC family, sensor kinase
MRNFFKIALLFTFVLFRLNMYASSIYEKEGNNFIEEIFYYTDRSNNLTIDQIKDSSHLFKKSQKDVLNFGISKNAHWIKVHVKNKSSKKNLIFSLNQPIIDEVSFYKEEKDREFSEISYGEYLPFSNRYYQSTDYLFDISMEPGSNQVYYLKVKSKENCQIPIYVSTIRNVYNFSLYKSLASGIYIGIMVVMIFYNLFIFFIFRDISYVKYSGYIILVLLTQVSLQGYTFQFLWPNFPQLAIYSPFLLPSLVGIAGLEFFKDFLKLKETYRQAHFFSFFFLVPYTVSIVLGFTGGYNLSFMIMEVNAALVSIFMLVIAYIVYKKGFKPARFFLIGWSVFLIGICIYVMKDFEILPYNNFTRYTMHIGSGIEVVLLSFALADKINILKKEKEESQAKALQISLENERLVTEQNIELEQKVKERTQKLEIANTQLTDTLQNLQSAQMQLVESEKMSSLGQLTAGIAHEINNPINFVSANISPLKLDIQDLIAVINTYDELLTSSDVEKILAKVVKLKEDINYELVLSEIQHLLHGIEDGAKRTSEIVRGLKSFSHLDEAEQKPADINEGIRSTLVLLKNSLVAEISLSTQLANLPLVECFPGKMNQVFMNILSNAIQAVKSKPVLKDEFIRVTTREINGYAVIEIEDSGPGIPKPAQIRIFEPFYTTKPVGEGTGLGLSIVFNIIKKHNGSIELDSEEGRGTKFTIRIPIKGNPENITS